MVPLNTLDVKAQIAKLSYVNSKNPAVIRTQSKYLCGCAWRNRRRRGGDIQPGEIQFIHRIFFEDL